MDAREPVLADPALTSTAPAAATTATPVTAQAGARLRWVLGLTSAAYFMVVLDSSVVLTALPSMQRALHAGLASLQWTVNAYGIAFAAGIITAAALGDRFGRCHGLRLRLCSTR